MAITQTGTVLEFGPANTNTGTVSATITVPADAELVVVGWSGYHNTANYFSGGSMTFTKGGTDTTMVNVSGADSNTNAWQCALFYQVLPDTGSNKSLKWDWAGTATSAGNFNKCSVTFWKGVDTADPVRGSAGTNANPIGSTGTITAASGDLIIVWVGAFAGGGEGTVDSWSNATELSEVTKANDADGAWSTASPSGNQTVGVATETNMDEGGIIGVSFKPAAAGGDHPASKRFGGIPGMAFPGRGNVWAPA